MHASCTLGLAMAVALAPTLAAARPCSAAALDAVHRAVVAVFGPEAEVSLIDPSCEQQGEQVVSARPEPGSRTAGAVRFVLFADGAADRPRRAGRVSATVHVVAPHTRARAALAPRVPLTDADVVAMRADVGRVPFEPLPQADVVIGRLLRRPVADAAVITRAAVDVPALVRSGGTVVTIARVDGIEVRGQAVAAQDGGLGEVVIVVNPDSRKRLRGRVVAESLVEVLHAS